jgi:hypothetical protein
MAFEQYAAAKRSSLVPKLALKARPGAAAYGEPPPPEQLMNSKGVLLSHRPLAFISLESNSPRAGDGFRPFVTGIPQESLHPVGADALLRELEVFLLNSIHRI